MSVSPTDDALIVALDFEGELNSTGSSLADAILVSANDRCTQS
jgi:hypothetical protein